MSSLRQTQSLTELHVCYAAEFCLYVGYKRKVVYYLSLSSRPLHHVEEATIHLHLCTHTVTYQTHASNIYYVPVVCFIQSQRVLWMYERFMLGISEICIK